MDRVSVVAKKYIAEVFMQMSMATSLRQQRQISHSG